MGLLMCVGMQVNSIITNRWNTPDLYLKDLQSSIAQVLISGVGIMMLKYPLLSTNIVLSFRFLLSIAVCTLIYTQFEEKVECD